jgi:hypothetical protein
MADETSAPNASGREKNHEFQEYKDAFAAYENGKQRRYQLLFAVNVAVLAISNIAPTPWRNVLLSVLMFLFTRIMTDDIRAFGKSFNDDYPNSMFREPGQRVLRNVRWILCAAWIGLALGALLALFGVEPGVRMAPPALRG